MRGKGVLLFSIRLLVGITPAYSGKSEELTREVRKHKDHPRVCGEK